MAFLPLSVLLTLKLLFFQQECKACRGAIYGALCTPLSGHEGAMNRAPTKSVGLRTLTRTAGQRPALISTVLLDDRRRPGGINVRRPLAGTRTSRPRKSAKNVETPVRAFPHCTTRCNTIGKLPREVRLLFLASLHEGKLES